MERLLYPERLLLMESYQHLLIMSHFRCHCRRMELTLNRLPRNSPLHQLPHRSFHHCPRSMQECVARLRLPSLKCHHHKFRSLFPVRSQLNSTWSSCNVINLAESIRKYCPSTVRQLNCHPSPQCWHPLLADR